MNFEKECKLIDYSLAPDTVSEVFCFDIGRGREYWVLVDNDKNSHSYGRIFSHQDESTPLNAEQTVNLLPMLHCAQANTSHNLGNLNNLITKIEA